MSIQTINADILAQSRVRYKYKEFEYRTYKTFHFCFRRRAEDGLLIEVSMPSELLDHIPSDLIPLDDFCKFVDEIELVEFVKSK